MIMDDTLRELVLATRRSIDSLCRELDVAGTKQLNDPSLRELAQSVTQLSSRMPAGDQKTVDASSPQAEQAARVYFDYALTGILETDQNWKILRANPAAASITGRDTKLLCSCRLHELAAASAVKLERHLSRLSEQGISQTELRITHSDGREIVIELASIQVDDLLYGHVFDDVTEQRQVSAEIEQARTAAEAANQAKSDFLANVSHELRTPMNGIIGLSQLALLTDLSQQQREYVANIARSGQNLLRIINDLLDASKLEAGRMDFELTPFSVAELLDDLAGVRAQIPSGKPLEVIFHVAPEVPRYLLGDRLRLGQCLINLLSNAIKFTGSGRVELKIDVTGSPDTSTLRLSVTDTGIGISAETMSRLFSAFSQADAATARRYGGSGLGLHISREFARGMGGDLFAESRVGTGSCFTLTLPLRKADETLHHDLPFEATASDAPQEFRGRRILVAEDDRVNQLVITQWLARAGILTTIAINGHEVLEQLTTGSAPPDVVLMDVQMPGMDGLEATRQLRRLGYTLPIIGLSAGASTPEQEICLTSGMNDFIAKPIDVDELWGCLTRWVPPRMEVDLNLRDDTSVEARFLHNSEALALARAVFLEDHGEDAARLRNLCATDDKAAMGRLAHGLKGASATLGFDALAALANEIETGAASSLPQDRGDEVINAIERHLVLIRARFASD